MNLEIQFIMLFLSKFDSPLLLSLIVIFGFFLMSILGSFSDWLFPVDQKKAKEKSDNVKERICQIRAKKYLEIERLEKEMMRLKKLNYKSLLKDITYKRNVLRNDFPNGLNTRELEILEELKEIKSKQDTISTEQNINNQPNATEALLDYYKKNMPKHY